MHHLSFNVAFKSSICLETILVNIIGTKACITQTQERNNKPTASRKA